jgi:phosphoglycolate phosphatase
LTDRRLYLFDIDGTLLTTGGAGTSAMRAAFARIYGVEDGLENVEVSGRSDLAIFQDALNSIGVPADAMTGAVRRLKRVYYGLLPTKLAERDGRLLPGVRELLEALAQDEHATMSLGTGNFRTSAGIKLRHFGIHEYFRGGGFGDRTGHRPTLIAQGIRAANRFAGRHDTVFVIGDTVHDVNAAKENNAVAVVVATGRASEAELVAAGADFVLPTLETALECLGAKPMAARLR